MFRPSAVIATTGCTYRQVDYWVRCGYIRPDLQATGQGSDRWFLGSSYMHACTVAALVLSGVSPDAADHLARGSDFPLGNGRALRITQGV